MPDPTESDEWIEELVERWTEVYKKSMTTLVLLRIVRDTAPASAATIEPAFCALTGWSLTERGTYRTIRRLASAGLLSMNEVGAARTGAKRKEYHLTERGHEYLRQIEGRTIGLDTQQ